MNPVQRKLPRQSSLSTSVSVTSSSATLLLTAKTFYGCTVSDRVVLTVKPAPDCTIKGGPDDNIIYAGSQGLYLYNDAAGNYTYQWSVEHTGVGTIAPTTGTGSSLTLNVSDNASGDFTVSLTMTDKVSGCSKTCTRTFTLVTLDQGCLIRGQETPCAGAQNVEYTLNAPASATSITWALSANTAGAAFDPAPAPLAKKVYVDAGAAGSYTLGATVIYPGGTLVCSRDSYCQCVAAVRYQWSSGSLLPENRRSRLQRGGRPGWNDLQLVDQR